MKIDYDNYKEQLLAVSEITDPAQLDSKLLGRAKYDPTTLQAQPFEGTSVIHNIDAQTTATLGLSLMVNQLIAKINAAGLTNKIAFVDTHSFHATTFDLINCPEHSNKLDSAGFSYAVVRPNVENAAVQFLRDIQLQLAATVKITGIGMFSPNVVKLNLQINEVVSQTFQAFRLGLHRFLLDRVAGYSVVRGAEWKDALAGHITLGYVVNSMTAQEIDSFMQVLQDFNNQFTPINFLLTQGEVTIFTDMNHYYRST